MTIVEDHRTVVLLTMTNYKITMSRQEQQKYAIPADAATAQKKDTTNGCRRF